MRSNIKKIGTNFEKEMCCKLQDAGWWVHFLSPNASGAQPFDIIAVKRGIALAADCKTSNRDIFDIERLEDNQILAFDKWMMCKNTIPEIFVKHSGKIYMIPYTVLMSERKCRLEDRFILPEWYGGDKK